MDRGAHLEAAILLAVGVRLVQVHGHARLQVADFRLGGFLHKKGLETSAPQQWRGLIYKAQWLLHRKLHVGCIRGRAWRA